MSANASNPPIPIDLSLPGENFTEADLRTAMQNAITPSFVKKLHHAHLTHPQVALTSNKKFSQGGGPGAGSSKRKKVAKA